MWLFRHWLPFSCPPRGDSRDKTFTRGLLNDWGLKGKLLPGMTAGVWSGTSLWRPVESGDLEDRHWAAPDTSSLHPPDLLGASVRPRAYWLPFYIRPPAVFSLKHVAFLGDLIPKFITQQSAHKYQHCTHHFSWFIILVWSKNASVL